MPKLTRKEAIEICLDHCDCSNEMDFLEQLTMDTTHNVAICISCHECFDIEPDGWKGESPCCPGNFYFSLTYLYGIPL